MAHGLAKFVAKDLIDKANSAIQLMDEVLDGDARQKNEVAFQEALQIALENQIMIAETLGLIKAEFDKFEEGLGKIL